MSETLNVNISSLIQTALNAGREIMSIYNLKTPIDIVEKENMSPLTLADLASNNIIRNAIGKLSSLPILSEEGKEIPYSIRKNWNNFWLIDPLDGTKEFIKRNDEFTVNIALIEKSNTSYTPIIGIVYAPALHKIYWNDSAHAYTSSTTNDHQIISSSTKIISSNSFSRSFRIVASRSHSNLITETFIKSLELQNKLNVEFISMGSSLKLCLVAEGLANIYPRLGPTMEWDTAAAHAICNKANCLVYQFNELKTNDKSKKMIYNKENLLNPYFIVEAI
jgi:3'(2'), 5'-bisphosphate nucleotidase